MNHTEKVLEKEIIQREETLSSLSKQVDLSQYYHIITTEHLECTNIEEQMLGWKHKSNKVCWIKLTYFSGT